jgi:hypothetical protein
MKSTPKETIGNRRLMAGTEKKRGMPEGSSAAEPSGREPFFAFYAGDGFGF